MNGELSTTVLPLAAGGTYTIYVAGEGIDQLKDSLAVQHAMSAAWNRLLGRVKQVCLLSLSEEELCGREPFDEMHESMAARAHP